MTRKSTRLSSASPPSVEKDPRNFVRHDEIYTDDYAYLRDRSDPRVANYIAEENSYAATVIRGWDRLRDQLFSEMRRRTEEDDASVPERIDDFWYYVRVRAGDEYPLHCRRRDFSDTEQVYLDENQLAGELDYFDLATLSVCPQHKLAAFAVDEDGNERYLLQIKDIDDGTFLQETLSDTGEDIVWLNNAATLIYTKTDENSRPYAVFAHNIGTPQSTDVPLYEERDPSFFVSVWKSRSQEYVFIETQSSASSEVRYITAQEPGQTPILVRPRLPKMRYYVDHHDERFLILTNLDSPNFRVMAAPVSTPSDWYEAIPEPADATLEYIEVFARHLVVVERHEGIERIRIHEHGSGGEHLVPFPDALYSVDVEDLDDYHSSFLRITYSSMVTPDQVIDYDVVRRTSALRKQRVIPGYDPASFQISRCHARAGDGTSVPISVLHRRDLTRDGSSPLLLLGYGAYEESLEMDFNGDLLSLVERGVVVASAHVRGGGELGCCWHEGGRMENKEHSFSDFLACAEYLIEEGFTSRGRIAAWGASAGGLLVAVAAHREPQLFAAIVAEAPFVDVVNTLLDASLPLTVHDYDEFGNPNLERDYRRLLGYSPYDTVREQEYPPMLVTTGFQDQRVGYWEALKWVAKLRAMKTDDNPLILLIEDAGHYGETGRYREMRHTALIYAFLLHMWGIADDDQL